MWLVESWTTLLMTVCYLSHIHSDWPINVKESYLENKLFCNLTHSKIDIKIRVGKMNGI